MNEVESGDAEQVTSDLENHNLNEAPNGENDEQTEMLSLSDDREQHIESESASNVSTIENSVSTVAQMSDRTDGCDDSVVTAAAGKK